MKELKRYKNGKSANVTAHLVPTLWITVLGRGGGKGGEIES
jgi:hypothetical protein